ncbi:Uncharacterised protein [uncultured archaeon]|nr:Uncharacterised protein [uncultured archaeon]
MKEKESLLVVSVDRDNDLGKKTGVQGPVIGRKACIGAAVKLAIADPSESDANSMFGAVKKYDEVSKETNAEVAFLTGVGKSYFESDRKISQQLDAVLEHFPATGFVLVTDGAEDDEVMPLLQARGPVVSKETIVVSQASEVEGLYFTLKNALNDPDIARTFILVPGLVIFIWGVLSTIGMEKLFFQSMLLIIGTYMVLKGTGLEARIAGAVESVTSSISLQRVSLPFYIMTIVFFLIGIFAAYQEGNNSAMSVVSRVSEAIGQMLLFLMLTAISFAVGKGIDTVQLKKAYYLRRYFLSGAAVFVLWLILDSARQVLAAAPYAGLEWFAVRALAAIATGYAAYRFSHVLDLRKKITKILIGLPVYGKDGKWLGVVETISKQEIEYRDKQTAKTEKLPKGKFLLSEGKIVLV